MYKLYFDTFFVYENRFPVVTYQAECGESGEADPTAFTDGSLFDVYVLMVIFLCKSVYKTIYYCSFCGTFHFL